jgi:hypothetical protein
MKICSSARWSRRSSLRPGLLPSLCWAMPGTVLANMKMAKQRHNNDPQRHWYFVFAVTRTWKQMNDKSLKDFVTYLPHSLFTRTWIAPLNMQDRRKIFWKFQKQMCLRHVGDVTVVLSKKVRNAGPKNTKILVTNLPGAMARQIITIYQRRRPIELVLKKIQIYRATLSPSKAQR